MASPLETPTSAKQEPTTAGLNDPRAVVALPSPPRRRTRPAALFSAATARLCGCLVFCAAVSAALTPGSPAHAQEKETAPPLPLPQKQTPPPPPSTPEGNRDRNARNVLPTPLTLAQAIEVALRLQPDIAGAAANRESSEQRLKQVQANYYPRVTPTYNYQYLYTFGTVQRIQDGGVVQQLAAGQTRTTRQGELSLNYTLFNSGLRELSNTQARQSLRGTRYSELNTRQAVIANVADAYFQALRTDALVTVSEAQVARAKNTLDVITAQVEVGVAARKDTLQAEADYLNAQVTLLGSRNDAEIAQAQLKNTIGVVGGTRLTLASVAVPSQETPLTVAQQDGQPLPPPSPVVDPEIINGIAEIAYRARPDIAQTRQALEVSQTGVRIARVNAGLQVNATLNSGIQYVPDDGNSRQANLSLSYPLFDGGNVRAQVREGQAQVRASEATLTSLQQQVAVEVEQAYRNLGVARATLPASEAAQRAAQINYEAALEARKEGVGSIVDVITAQTQLVQAQTNYIQAIYDFYAADARLARAVGQAERIGGPDSPVNNPGGTGAAVPLPAPGGAAGTTPPPPTTAPPPTTPPPAG